MQAADILILSNGPGEVTTWVRPVVKALRQQLGDDLPSDRSASSSLVRISVVLCPCPNATGKEAAIAQSYPEVDRVQGAEHFWRFLLWGKTAENWPWHDKGVVVFLGGDQFFPVVISRRLAYRTVVYAEWDARWHRWIDQFGVMKPEIIAKAPKKYSHKFTVVGDLMADVSEEGKREQKKSSTPPHPLTPSPPHPLTLSPPHPLTPSPSHPLTPSPPHPLTPSPSHPLIGLLPGSKPAKLSQGVPLGLAIAEHIHQVRPQTRFVIPVAPTLDLSALARFADPQQNPLIQKLGWAEAQLVIPSADTSERPFLKTESGLCVELWTDFPAYDLLSQCHLCLTTVGANTAQLGSLAVPMIVLISTLQMDSMRSWDGLPGILARLPGVGSNFAKVINWIVAQQGRLFAWPNIWAQKEIVPELVGKIQPQEVAQLVLDYLEHPEKLEEMRSQLRQVRGQAGAAQKLAQLVRKELDQTRGVGSRE